VAIILETPRLNIRHPERQDIDDLVNIFASRVCARFLGGVTTAEETRNRFECVIDFQEELNLDEKLGTWVIHHKTDNRCIGEAGLNLYEIDGTEAVAMHGVLAFSYWGKGLALEFFSALRDYCFYEIGLQRVVGKIHPDNKPSLKVARDIFMEYEREVEDGCHLYSVQRFCWLDDEKSNYFQRLLNVAASTDM